MDSVIITYELAPELNADDYEIAVDETYLFNPMDNDVLNTEDYVVDITSEPLNGVVTRNADNSYTFVPQTGWAGVTQFSYEVCNLNCFEKCEEVSITFKVGLEVDCIIPTVFTPNNDGENDEFVIPCVYNSEGSKITVINRWGAEVYSARDYQNDWKGEYKNEPLPAGTYYYFLELGDETGTQFSGYIYIMR